MRSSCLTLQLQPCDVTIAVSLTAGTLVINLLSISDDQIPLRGTSTASCHKPYSNCRDWGARRRMWMR